MSTPRRFGIFAHVGNGNLGDEATVAALLQNIRVHCPGAEILVFSANPEDTGRRHGVVALPIGRAVASRQRKPSPVGAREPSAGGAGSPGVTARVKAWLKSIPGLGSALQSGQRTLRLLGGLPGEIWFLYRSFGALRGIDRLIVAGGGQLGDYFGGPWGYPLGIFRWCALARAAGARVAFLSVGAEPIRSAISRWLLRRALAMADYRSFRDEGSSRLIESIGAPPGGRVCPDLVHGLSLPLTSVGRGTGPGLTVGINPVPFFDARYWTEHDDRLYERYVDTVAAFASWLLERGHRIVFFPTQVRADPPVIHDIELVMKRTARTWPADRVLIPSVTDFPSLTAALAMVDVVVASRFHGIVFALLLDIPVLGLSYYRKTEELMADMGQGDYVFAIRQLHLSALITRFTQLESRLALVRDQIRRRRLEQQQVLDEQYTQLLQLTPSREANREGL